ncbi:MAG TPA: serine/threonine-protein kinase [Ilumatobacter sp.]|nr:serine/threonine-protein kinase [Ilumatobacter sp.]
MTRRQVSRPPLLPGFEFVEVIGSGGYADVFLYEQQSPSRRVAVKVLDPGAVPSGSVADYTAEANLMAKVSAHPYIVQVFMAAVAPDGRPYLVMEYYPGRNFYDRARDEQMSVADVLRVGVQLASAVETAHRAGVLHRDIKPANVLTSEYRRPGLTDFGIASVQGPQADTADGLSIPWSPPEAMGEAPFDVRSDVYSLAATVYTLLAGRSPFEVKGGDNRPLALIARIERNPVPPIGRPDVPPLLERVLAGAMAKSAAHRPTSAAEFGRQLQQVESELNLAVTTLELAEEAGSVRARRGDEPDDDATRVKGVVEVQAQAPAAPAAPPIASIPAGAPHYEPVVPAPSERRREGLLAEPDIADTVHGVPVASAELPALAAPSGPPKVLYAALAAAAVLIAVIVGVVMTRGGGDDAKSPVDDGQVNVEVNDDLDLAGPQPVAALDPREITVAFDADGYTFTWPSRGAGFLYAVISDSSAVPAEVTEPTFTGPDECVEIAVIAPDGRMSAGTPVAACAGGGQP